MQLVKLQANPGVIYASSKADDRLLQALKRPCMAEGDGGGAGEGAGFCVKIERAAAFHYDKVRGWQVWVGAWGWGPPRSLAKCLLQLRALSTAGAAWLPFASPP